MSEGAGLDGAPEGVLAEALLRGAVELGEASWTLPENEHPLTSATSAPAPPSTAHRRAASRVGPVVVLITDER